jgi:hypothetical protein
MGFSPTYGGFRHLCLNGFSTRVFPAVSYKAQSRPVLIAPVCIYPGVIKGFQVYCRDGYKHDVVYVDNFSKTLPGYIYLTAKGHKQVKTYASLEEALRDYMFILAMQDEMDFVVKVATSLDSPCGEQSQQCPLPITECS